MVKRHWNNLEKESKEKRKKKQRWKKNGAHVWKSK